MLYLVSYDITNDRTRTKVIKHLKSRRGYRLQKSLFAIDLNEFQLSQLKKNLIDITKGKESIMFFRQCKSCKEWSREMKSEEGEVSHIFL